MNYQDQTPQNDPEDRSLAERIAAHFDRLAFNQALRGHLAEQFTQALENRSIHEMMISDALGHPVPFRSLQIFLESAVPGTFDPEDVDELDFPIFTEARLSEQERYKQIVINQLREYASLSAADRLHKFGSHPGDLEPELSSLISQFDQGELAVADILDQLTSR